MRILRPLLLVSVLFLAVACASLRSSGDPRTTDAIRSMDTGEGNCTTWAVGPSKWITAAHCFAPTPATIDGIIVEWITIDPVTDLALIGGPPSTRHLRIASRTPRIGQRVQSYGYGLNRPLLLILSGDIISLSAGFFLERPREMILSSNGMPGMSGGPILQRGRVVGIVTGGGNPGGFSQNIGTGVSWSTLAAFIRRTGAAR